MKFNGQIKNNLVMAILLTGASVAHSTMITSATFDLDPGSLAADADQDGVVDNPLSFTSITVGGTVYNNLTYGTAIWASGTAERYYTPGDDPVTQVAALSGSYVTDGALNINVNTAVVFGREITADDVIFMTELVTATGSGETVAFGLTDNLGTPIAGTAVLFGSIGTIDLLTFESLRSAASGYIGDVTARGSGYTLAELGDPGATAPYGIYFSSSSAGQLDPGVVGLATAVPEPSTASLLCFAAGMLFWRRSMLS